MTFSGHLRHFCDGEQIKALLKAANAWQMSKTINYGTQKGIFLHSWPILRVFFTVWMFLRLTSSFSLNHNSQSSHLLITSGCRPPLSSRSQHREARNPEDSRPWGWQYWGTVPWIILIKFQKIASESIDAADYDKVNFHDKHWCIIKEYHTSDINLLSFLIIFLLASERKWIIFKWLYVNLKQILI